MKPFVPYLLRAYISSLILFFACVGSYSAEGPSLSGLRVGAAAAELQADDSMVIAGGITAGRAGGQEGKLRAVAIVLEKKPIKLAIVACDILMITREHLDPVVMEIQQTTGISAST